MSQAGVASIKAPSGGTVVETLTGNSGGPVSPDGSDNINLLGAGGVTVSGNAGTHTLTISVSGEGQTWNAITMSQTMAVNNSYVCISPGTNLSLALPAVCNLGDTIEVTLDGATSFTITQQTGQSIRFGQVVSTTTSGTLASNFQGDAVTMVCTVANTRWNVINDEGTLTVS